MVDVLRRVYRTVPVHRPSPWRTGVAQQAVAASSLGVARLRWPLTLSIWPAVAATGWAQGLVEWCAVLMPGAALLLVLLLPYRPRLALPAAPGLLASPVAAFATL